MAFLMAPPVNAAWYKDSLSYTLHKVAQNGQPVLPRDLLTLLEEAAGRVQIHECYVHDMYASTGGRPFQADPLFVYNGYKSAMGNLWRTLSQPGGDSLARIHMCSRMHGYLHSILLVIYDKSNNPRLLEDPEMGRHVAAFSAMF